MADEIITCSAPECTEQGTSFCSSCGLVKYCSRTCQTEDWVHHKEECQGHLRKLGEAQLLKARGFHKEGNSWGQTLRCSELALVKLEKLKDRPLDVIDEAMRMAGEAHLEMAIRFQQVGDATQALRGSELALTTLKKLKARPLETIKIIDKAFTWKFNTLNSTGQKKEARDCAEERYSLWAAGHMRNYGMFDAAFPLIEALIHNKEFDQAHLIASTANEMIINDTDNIIPDDQRQYFLAQASHLLGLATYRLAESGGIPSGEMQKAGEEAIALARKSLEIDTQLHGTQSNQVALNAATLANVLKYFNGIDIDDGNEIFRLYEQSIFTYSRVQGVLSLNVAANEKNLGAMYRIRAMKAEAADDLDGSVANLELSLPHFRKGERIYREINLMDAAEKAAQAVVLAETELRKTKIIRAAAAAEATES